MEHKATLLTPPPLHNSSCSHPRFSATAAAAASSSGASGAGTPGGGGPGGAGDGTGVRPTTSVLDVAQAIFVLLLTAGVLGANLLLIIVINSRRYTKYIHAQPRYLLTSLASNDLAIGLLVIPFGFIPALYHCWPYGEVFCQIQALLRGALSQQSAVILICMAIDRYMCMLHPARYHRHSSKKVSLPQGCVAVMSITWVTSLTLFAAMVLPRGGSATSKDGTPNPAAIRGYYFNGTGLLACDPFFSRAALRILASCLLYFPTTMVLMYCYGSAFHMNKLRVFREFCVISPEVDTGGQIHTMIAQERRLSTSASRTMAAMSLGFIVMVTPWTIQEVVAACTGSKVPPFVDFVATWLALSNSFWNPFLYWLLNNNFRRISRELLISKIPFRRWWRTHVRRRGVASLPADGHGPPRCCSGRQAVVLGGGHVGGVAGVVGGACVGGAAAPGDTPESEAVDALGTSIVAKDPEEGEKHWGEILERTVSSNSLQALQRIYGAPHGPGRKLRYQHRAPRPLPPTPKSPADPSPEGETESAEDESPAPATPLPPPPPPPPLPPLPLPHHYHHLGTCPHANLNNIHPMEL
ncbi:trace amine-associated receptor 8b [Hetaerina americana]|uniref:trace amine-associated receptor 8b n=1 Tax=Hetaerina americana TaxID=62018 RepID=UPI003A7F1E7A